MFLVEEAGKLNILYFLFGTTFDFLETFSSSVLERLIDPPPIILQVSLRHNIDVYIQWG